MKDRKIDCYYTKIPYVVKKISGFLKPNLPRLKHYNFDNQVSKILYRCSSRHLFCKDQLNEKLLQATPPPRREPGNSKSPDTTTVLNAYAKSYICITYWFYILIVFFNTPINTVMKENPYNQSKSRWGSHYPVRRNYYIKSMYWHDDAVSGISLA